MIRVKFYKLDRPYYPGLPYPREGVPAEITVNTDDIAEAFEAACDAGGDPFRKMNYTYI